MDTTREPLTPNERDELAGYVGTFPIVARGVLFLAAMGIVWFASGFVFGLLDYAAMLAVNDPNVVLGSADLRFVAPVKVGDEVVAEATVVEEKGKKRVCDCTARVGDKDVLTGTLTTFVLDEHVLG